MRIFLILNIVFSDSLILFSNIVYKNVAIAIARHETGNYTSKSYKIKNNLFGFSTNRGVIKFQSKQSSINSYINFEKRIIKKYNIKNERQYLDRISRFYSHKAHRKKWKQKIIQNLNGV